MKRAHTLARTCPFNPILSVVLLLAAHTPALRMGRGCTRTHADKI